MAIIATYVTPDTTAFKYSTYEGDLKTCGVLSVEEREDGLCLIVYSDHDGKSVHSVLCLSRDLAIVHFKRMIANHLNRN